MYLSGQLDMLDLPELRSDWPKQLFRRGSVVKRAANGPRVACWKALPRRLHLPAASASNPHSAVPRGEPNPGLLEVKLLLGSHDVRVNAFWDDAIFVILPQCNTVCI